MLFSKEDIISCYGWRKLADYIYEKSTGLDNLPESGQICWSPTNHIKDLFSRLEGSGKSVILISSFCDWGLALQQEYQPCNDLIEYAKILVRQYGKEIGFNGIQIPPRVDINKCNPNHKYVLRTNNFTHETFPEIPKEIKKWYLVNNQLPLDYNNKIINIPFGIQMNSEERWVENADFNSKRDKKYYICWMDYTLERADIKNTFRKYPDIATVIETEVPHNTFRDHLKEHQMVIASESVGLDTFRMLESLYCGAIPIIKYNPTNLGLDLPCIFYETIDDLLNKEHIDYAYKSVLEVINNKPEVLDKIKFSYWKSVIANERKKLLSGEYNND